MDDSLGIYLAIPFCKAKCSFCNFASDVFAGVRMQRYVDRLCAEMRDARAAANRLGAALPGTVDSVYFGGGTPSLLEPALFRQIFDTLRGEFNVADGAETTVECAPGQISGETLDELLCQRVNRLSFGVQSFVDQESAAVGRTHTRDQCLEEFDRVHRAGIDRLSLDLIAGLPHQTPASWLYSVDQAIESGVEHVSIYMLEVDEDSRLGREALQHGRRYHADALPPDDAVADWYLDACDRLNSAGIAQYEISNFARAGAESRHNLKYWRRDPYLGFGLDAHSMLLTGLSKRQAVRWSNPAEMDGYLAESSAGLNARFAESAAPETDFIGEDASFEEAIFLGLRLNCGIDLDDLARSFGPARIESIRDSLSDLSGAELIEGQGSQIRLTGRGRTVSNEVFSRLLLTSVA